MVAVIQTKNLLLPCFVIHSPGGGNEQSDVRDRALCHCCGSPSRVAASGHFLSIGFCPDQSRPVTQDLLTGRLGALILLLPAFFAAEAGHYGMT